MNETERVAAIFEAALVRHGVNPMKIEGTLDDATAAIAAMRGEPVSLMDQIKRDAALVAALPEHERRNYQREFEAVFCNPGITFPTPPDSGKD